MDKLRRALLGQIAKLTAGAALVPLSSLPSAGINSQPPRREGDPTKRYARLSDLRAGIGCLACSVPCDIQNAAPLGDFGTTGSQSAVAHADPGELPTFMLPRLRKHRDNR